MLGCATHVIYEKLTESPVLTKLNRMCNNFFDDVFLPRYHGHQDELSRGICNKK